MVHALKFAGPQKDQVLDEVFKDEVHEIERKGVMENEQQDIGHDGDQRLCSAWETVGSSASWPSLMKLSCVYSGSDRAS